MYKQNILIQFVLTVTMDNKEKNDEMEVVDEEKVHFTRCINALRAYRLDRF